MTSPGMRHVDENGSAAHGELKRACLIKTLFFLTAFCVVSFFQEGRPAERRTLPCTVEEAVARARAHDLEYKRLAFTRKELARSKKNLYRTFFPRINAGFSSSDLVYAGEPDASNYRFNLTIEEVLYDQLSALLQLKNYGMSLEEANLVLAQRESAITQEVVNVYLDILLGEEMMRNKGEELALYGQYVELVRGEYELGMKTMLDVIEAEKKTLETELEAEELESRREILFKDLANMIGAGGGDFEIELSSDVNDILAATLGFEGISSFDEAHVFVSEKAGRLLDSKLLRSTALGNDIALKKNRLLLVQNRLKRRLLALQYLDNVSLSYSVDFTGDRFFPANTTHTVAVNLLLDFGVLSSDVSLAGTSGEGLKAQSSSAESKVLESLDPLDAGRYLRIEAFTAGEQIDRTENEIVKRVDVWVVKMKSLLKRHAITLKRREIFDKNEELLEAKLRTGQAKKIDRMEFLIGKSEFLLEFEKLKYDFIRLVWEIEDLTGVRFAELAR
jgi:hypothetical protein